MIFVECKNWKSPVPAKEIGAFRTKMRDHKVQTGIFVAANGLTGKGSHQYAKDQVRDSWINEDKPLFVIDKKDLESLFNCTSLTDLIEDKFCELYEM